MSLDKSLKIHNRLVRHRNVLTRTERIEKLKEEDKWEEERSVFGLPKVKHRKVTIGGKHKEKPEAEAEVAEGEAAEAASEGTPQPEEKE
jgi:small basic protein (TIGR04137 family)